MNRWLVLTLGLLFVMLGLQLHADDAVKPITLDELLTHARQTQGLAADGAGRLTPLAGKGQAHFRGVRAPYQLQMGSFGTFVESVEHRLGYQSGFNSKQCWRADADGYSQVLELMDRDLQLLVHWVHSGYWLHSQAPLHIQLVAASKESPTLSLLVDMKNTKMKSKLELDRTTWLPKQLEYLATSGPVIWIFEDYRKVGGRSVAHRVIERHDRLTEKKEIEQAEQLSQEPACNMPKSKPTSITFKTDRSPKVETTRSTTGHLLVKALVNDKDMGWFIFDSGAGAMIIDPSVAKEMNMEAMGDILMVGLGGNQTSHFRLGQSFQLGQAVLRDPVFIELNMKPFAALMGHKIVGICGYPFIARCLIEVEPVSTKMEVHDPAQYQLVGGSWQELVLHHNLPTVRARFEGDREDYFRLDTGANTTVDFHTPAVREYDLLVNRKTTPRLQGGVGGLVKMQQGTLEWFELGGVRFEHPVVGFAQSDKGAFADPYIAGNIGIGFMKSFRIVFNYPAKKIAFVRRGDTLDGGNTMLCR